MIRPLKNAKYFEIRIGDSYFYNVCEQADIDSVFDIDSKGFEDYIPQMIKARHNFDSVKEISKDKFHRISQRIQDSGNKMNLIG